MVQRWNVYAWSGAKARVEQTIGRDSEHHLGVATKVANGPWQANGSVGRSIAQGAGQEVGNVADAAIYNSWNYREYIGSTSASLERDCKTLFAISVYDIFNEPYTYAPHQNFPYACVSKSHGAALRKVTHNNVTYAAGVDLGPINVSARSGYDNGTEIRWTVDRNSKACSNNVDGWVQASQVDVRAG